MSVSSNYWAKQCAVLKGQTCLAIVVDKDDEDQEYIGLVFEHHVVWIECDDEGNGPGVPKIIERTA